MQDGPYNPMDQHDELALALQKSIVEAEEMAAQRTQDLQDLREVLSEWKLASVDVERDGNCQFTALVMSGRLQMTPSDLRAMVVQHMRENEDRFRAFANHHHDCPWELYLHLMSCEGEFGDHLTLMAAAEILRAPITVLSATQNGKMVNVPTTLPLGSNTEPPIVR